MKLLTWKGQLNLKSCCVTTANAVGNATVEDIITWITENKEWEKVKEWVPIDF